MSNLLFNFLQVVKVRSIEGSDSNFLMLKFKLNLAFIKFSKSYLETVLEKI